MRCDLKVWFVDGSVVVLPRGSLVAAEQTVDDRYRTSIVKEVRIVPLKQDGGLCRVVE